MKRFNYNKAAILLPLFVLTAIFFNYYPGFSRFFRSTPPTDPQYLIDERNNIIGTFVSEEDLKWTVEFSSNGKCYDYYDGTLVATSSYSLSNATPQCGTNVLVDENQKTSYLSLTDDTDGISICYAINGVTSSMLSLTAVPTQQLLLLTRK